MDRYESEYAGFGDEEILNRDTLVRSKNTRRRKGGKKVKSKNKVNKLKLKKSKRSKKVSRGKKQTYVL